MTEIMTSRTVQRQTNRNEFQESWFIKQESVVFVSV